MKFKITRHSGFKVPDDALDQLFAVLGARRGDVSFAKVGPLLTARWNAEPSVGMERDAQVSIGRREVLNVVLDVCSRTPELESDWYAVSSSE
jgi:hypothetical protein